VEINKDEKVKINKDENYNDENSKGKQVDEEKT